VASWTSFALAQRGGADPNSGPRSVSVGSAVASGTIEGRRLSEPCEKRANAPPPAPTAMRQISNMMLIELIGTYEEWTIVGG